MSYPWSEDNLNTAAQVRCGHAAMYTLQQITEQAPEFFSAGFGWDLAARLAESYSRNEVDIDTLSYSDCVSWAPFAGLGSCLGMSAMHCAVQSTKWCLIRKSASTDAKGWFRSCYASDIQYEKDWSVVKVDPPLVLLRKIGLESAFYGSAAFAAGITAPFIFECLHKLTLQLTPIIAAAITGVTTGFVCGLVFLVVLLALRLLLTKGGCTTNPPPLFLDSEGNLTHQRPYGVKPFSGETCWQDFALSLWKVAFSSATFLLTVYFPGFQASNLVVQALLSGATVTLGYVGAQVLTIPCIAMKPSIKNMLVHLGCMDRQHNWTLNQGCGCHACAEHMRALRTRLGCGDGVIAQQPRAQAEHGDERAPLLQYRSGQQTY